MYKYLLFIKIILLKFFYLNLSFIKREISGYPKHVIEFEKYFSKYVGRKYGLTFCNGTSAIEAAIYALNLDKNSEILIPSSTFHASIGPILSQNFKIKFVDIDNETLTIDCDDLEKKINKNTRALIIVHPWGYPCDMSRISEITKKNQIKLIEDCSHAHGAKYKNNMIGSYGDISCFSLQGNKAVAGGEAGISLTNDNEYYLRMSVFGHFNRFETELRENENLKSFSKTGLSKKLRAHPFSICLAKVDLKNIDKLNYHKTNVYKKIDKIVSNYNFLKTMRINENSLRGGFFGGYPIIIVDEINKKKIIDTFNSFNLKLIKYPWLNHHKMKIYTQDNIKLDNTEEIYEKFFLLNIPYLLNFNYKILFKCLEKISKEIG